MIQSDSGAGKDQSFLLLAATLLDALPSSSTVPDSLLIQLHSIFGPMLLSALQLIDRREVVLISLPGGRTIYQVTSSTGLPYTLYNSLPAILHPPPDLPIPEEPIKRSPSPTPMLQDPFVESTASPPPIPSEPVPISEKGTDRTEEADRELWRRYEHERVYRIRHLADGLQRMFCPCAGFLFNSLGGERNFLCKHLLSVLIAHHTEKMVKTEVYLPGIVELLGLGKKVDEAIPVEVA